MDGNQKLCAQCECTPEDIEADLRYAYDEPITSSLAIDLVPCQCECHR